MEMQKQTSEESQLIVRDEDDDIADERQCSRCCGFPTAVYFIIVNEFCERFYYYGMRATLVLYLTQYVGLNTASALAIYHSWTAVTYFTPLLGGILADSYFGKYNTILWVSLMYMTGAVVLSLTAIPAPNLGGPIVGLLLIGFGSGGIKACTSAFGADQIPAHKMKLQESFFSMFYFAINAGSFLSTIITPIFRADVKCFHQNTCYPLSFGFPAILMAIAIIVFVLGKSRYIMKPHEESIVLRSFKCCWHGFKSYLKNRKEVHKNSWIDHANDLYEETFIDNVKVIGRISLLFLPLLMFWSLFDQQSSRWVLQGSLLNGNLFNGVHILPDQMTAINPVFILIFIPLFESAFYPLVEKIGIPNKPLRRMTAGMFLASFAFLISFFLQIKIESTMPASPKVGSSRLSIVSLNENCTLHAVFDGTTVNSPAPFQASASVFLPSGMSNFNLTLKCEGGKQVVKEAQVKMGDRKSYILCGWQPKGGSGLSFQAVPQSLKKDKKGRARVRAIYREDLGIPTDLKLSATRGDHVNKKKTYSLTPNNASYGLFVTKYYSVDPNVYLLYIPQHMKSVSVDLGKLSVTSGEVVTILPHHLMGGWKQSILTEVAGNTISILWQIPQLIVMTAAEILVSITGLSYSYTQAPVSMKSTVLAIWLVTVGLGNLVVAFVAELEALPKKSWDFLVFTILGFITTLIFAVDAYFYVPNEKKEGPPEAEKPPIEEDVGDRS